ncbi:MAG: penicillin-binding protein [Lachnospiraceae bacterium]|nr:penicillin-binding protein [Lachnospiraceae bacterium]
MLYDIRDRIINFISSRVFLLFVALIIVASVLINRIFQLQIVHGSEYLNNFTLSIEKEVSLPSTRGNIYDRNGVLLAYNELAYSVCITDTIESGNGKNERLNTIIYNMMLLLNETGEEISSDFPIYLDEFGNYSYSVEGNALLRFLADVYGHASTSDLLYAEKTANPDTVIAYLAGEDKYAVGGYLEADTNDTFVMGLGYSKEDILNIVNIRYNLSLNAFQKYIATTVATDVGEETVALIMENSDILQGVTIEEESLRRYNDSVYFAPIIGYTGRISQAEYEEYTALGANYTLNDLVGKAGIEQTMELQLQGIHGSETIYVDNLGKIIEIENIVNPVAGNDIYLTIDSELQIATYNLLEQKIAGILVSKIINARESASTGRNVQIPIYDVYFALINNNIIDLNHMSKTYAGETEQTVYQTFLGKQESVLATLEEEMLYGDTPYNQLSTEYMVYESFIISMLSSANYGVILTDQIDSTDQTYLNWRVQENISIKEYLTHAIAMQWIDVTKLDLNQQYADSSEIYNALVEYILQHLSTNQEFTKLLYKYMILNDLITGKQICNLLWEQDIIQVAAAEMEKLNSGRVSSYSFMVGLISDLKITPAQLGLEPCSGSCVVTDVNTGEVLALVSYPGYDNNRLANRADANYLAQLNSDLSRPLWNYATQQRTAPGSTFKMVSSVAGVMENVVSTSTPITCTGVFDKLNGTVHRCWISPGAHGSLTLRGAIEHSCNNYFYEVGYRLAYDGSGYNDTYGIERIAIYADMFGLSERSGVEIPESEPQVSDQYPVPSAIGQGNHNYTTVGLARYVTAVANSGTVFQLSLIYEITDSGGNILYEYTPTVRNQITLDDGLWNAIHSGMHAVVENKPYFQSIELEAAGKTGTAQEATNRPNHALFVGYAPYDNPEIAIAVRIANGYSSDYAAQVARDVFKYYFNLAEITDIITGTASEEAGTTGGD